MNNLKKSALFLVVILSAFTKPATLTVTSAAFNEGQMIPAKYSCEGAEVSPPLTVTGMPTGTKSLAIIVHDHDAPHPGGVYHWVAWNLPANGSIAEDFKGGVQGFNNDKKNGYKAICPPPGSHRYNFKVYALDKQLQLSTSSDHAALETAMQGHILAQAVLMGRYSKNK